MRVRLEHLTKRFSDVTAVSDFSASLEHGELISLLGPSGCGKSTILNMLAGILPVTSGKIYFDDDDVTNMPPEKRGIGLVFQNYALYPHMTVLQNICFPLEVQKVPKAERVERDLTSHARFSRIEPYMYLLPFLIGILAFTLYPVINVIFMSFKEDYSYLTREFAQWGVGNYEKVFADPKFEQAIVNTLKYVVLVVPISTCIAVVVAYLLNQKLRFSALFQTAYFLPMVTSITAVGLAWRLMYNERFGIINYMLSWFGVDPIGWLTKAQYSMPALVIFGIWNILPFTIILLLSGLQNIDEQYYTAAKVDGARSLRIFFRITVPLLAPTIFLVCIVNTISSFKVFSELYPLFKGEAGPFYNLYTVVYYIRYAMMESREYGVAAAAALVLFLFILVFTMVQLLIQRKWQHRR